MPMRTIESECLLCRTNKATKTNSHIVPKFVTKSLLGNDNLKRAFTIASSGADRPPIISQDSPKEDFILCPECESYFSVLETEASRNFFNGIWAGTPGPKFMNKTSSGKMMYKELVQMHRVLFHLFIFSIVWRCSITSIRLFQYLKLNESEGEGLRKTLLLFKALTLEGLLAKLTAENEAALFPSYYVLLTSQAFTDQTRNVVFIPAGNKNPYFLVLNQFQLMISFAKNEKQNMMAEVGNSTQSTDLIKVVFLTQATWQTFLDKLVQRYAGASKSALDKVGKQPYFLPDDKLKKV